VKQLYLPVYKFKVSAGGGYVFFGVVAVFSFVLLFAFVLVYAFGLRLWTCLYRGCHIVASSPARGVGGSCNKKISFQA
jgi:hypothetical protein